MNRHAYIVGGDQQMAAEVMAAASHAGFETALFGSRAMLNSLMPGLAPGVMVVDINLPDGDGVELIAAVRRDGIHLPVGIADTADVPAAVRAMRAGAVNFFVRPCKMVDLVNALHEAHLQLGQLIDEHGRRATARQAVADLTPRQRQILEGLVNGERNETISRRLGLSRRTVESYRKRMMERLAATSVADAVRVGLDAGLKPLPAAPAAD